MKTFALLFLRLFVSAAGTQETDGEELEGVRHKNVIDQTLSLHSVWLKSSFSALSLIALLTEKKLKLKSDVIAQGESCHTFMVLANI